MYMNGNWMVPFPSWYYLNGRESKLTATKCQSLTCELNLKIVLKIYFSETKETSLECS
jgi:hypothetical protein